MRHKHARLSAVHICPTKPTAFTGSNLAWETDDSPMARLRGVIPSSQRVLDGPITPSENLASQPISNRYHATSAGRPVNLSYRAAIRTLLRSHRPPDLRPGIQLLSPGDLRRVGRQRSRLAMGGEAPGTKEGRRPTFSGNE
jgi:hypothetical protein